MEYIGGIILEKTHTYKYIIIFFLFRHFEFKYRQYFIFKSQITILVIILCLYVKKKNYMLEPLKMLINILHVLLFSINN